MLQVSDIELLQYASKSYHEIVKTFLDDAGLNHLVLHGVADGVPLDAVAQGHKGLHLSILVIPVIQVELVEVQHVLKVTIKNNYKIAMGI